MLTLFPTFGLAEWDQRPAREFACSVFLPERSLPQVNGHSLAFGNLAIFANIDGVVWNPVNLYHERFR